MKATSTSTIEKLSENTTQKNNAKRTKNTMIRYMTSISVERHVRNRMRRMIQMMDTETYRHIQKRTSCKIRRRMWKKYKKKYIGIPKN
jgi:hypothetical protein